MNYEALILKLAEARAAVAVRKSNPNPNGSPLQYTFRSLGEIEADRRYDRLDKALNDCMVLNKRNNTLTLCLKYPYEIDLDRVREPLHLLRWVLHLLGKPWFERDCVEPFILKVCAAKGWNPRL
jgi:hypothetical protein